MISDALNITGTTFQPTARAADQVDVGRKKNTEAQGDISTDPGKTSVPSEEILNKIKALTENGAYSVRFENDSATKEMVVKIVNSDGEIIRQVPPESLLGLRKALSDYQGNIVITTS